MNRVAFIWADFHLCRERLRKSHSVVSRARVSRLFGSCAITVGPTGLTSLRRCSSMDLVEAGPGKYDFSSRPRHAPSCQGNWDAISSELIITFITSGF